LRTEAFRDTYQIKPITYNAFEWGEMRRLIRDVRHLSSGLQKSICLYQTLEQRRDEYCAKTKKFFDELAEKLNRKP
jgi:hypothetical protein